MKKILIIFLSIILASVIVIGYTSRDLKFDTFVDDLISVEKDTILSEKLVYHKIRVDQNGHILPWYSKKPGESYDHVMHLVWSFWKNMEMDSNGIKYYMNHQVWHPRHDMRGLGGDQLMMAMSSWDLYYNYTGDESLIENMKYMADYYLENSLSPSDSQWPDLPYPYNMVIHSGKYDGDMILGLGYLQPDKAGSFGFELIHLYKKTGAKKYLNAAIKIANTLAAKVQPGDSISSPWPFKVHAETGEVGILVENVTWYEGMDQDLKKPDVAAKKSSYTTFWTGTLGLFSELMNLNEGNSVEYKKAIDITIAWMKTYPAKTNKWGPFFEDIPRWSDTQINAMTYAMYIMEHQDLHPEWKETAKFIIDWVYDELGNHTYSQYGVVPIDEQTAYRVPGNSHSSRQASMDLLYYSLTGDTSLVHNAIRQLNWATYMVDTDGKNFYPTNAIWMTDGYGDYVRHYLRAIAAVPQLAPENADHLLRSSSIIQKIEYHTAKVSYTTFDNISEEVLRLNYKPKSISLDGNILKENDSNGKEGWFWKPLKQGGVLEIRHTEGNRIEILK
jgi:hypothetical protein